MLEGRVRCATPLLAALVVVEAPDILFAIDSVPAVLSITQTAIVAYSSIVFAVLGLRALYFALEGLVDRFVYLHYGLAVILVFVGAKFVVQGFGVQVPIVTSLLVIASPAGQRPPERRILLAIAAPTRPRRSLCPPGRPGRDARSSPLAVALALGSSSALYPQELPRNH